MKWSDINNVNLDNIGSAPWPFKSIVIGCVCAGLVFGGWKYLVQEKRETLERVTAEETQLKQTFETKQAKVVNLDRLKRQLAEIKETFGEMLRRLPDKAEVAALLVDISQQGLGAGLEFELFKPGQEKPSEFYAELPIEIRVTGGYHAFGQFVSGVSDLPRIVTQHDIKIKLKAEKKGLGQALVMESVAKTYRYLDEAEEANQ
ncbi:MAG: type 4a pilus biogenesis protein PilO [Gammaproteobacteria bacterium]